MAGTILLLGGTAEARALAEELQAAGIRVISSLAGRVARPRLPVGEVRIGGFGGPDALAEWLTEQGISAVVDATHPFAERISASAAAACAVASVPLLRLERPGWTAGDGDDWHWVEDLKAAAAAVPQLGSRVLLTAAARAWPPSRKTPPAGISSAASILPTSRCLRATRSGSIAVPTRCPASSS